VMAACVEAGIPASPVRSYAETARDPHVLERDMLQEVEQEDGRVAPLTGPAAKFSRTPTRVRSRAAKLGEHTEEILQDLGFDAAARRQLRDAKIV
jgi:crotonobetainyl-CoA:carnitine CoA-transferase CaiB-like acyl-CoA transferase